MLEGPRVSPQRLLTKVAGELEREPIYGGQTGSTVSLMLLGLGARLE